MNLDQNLRTFNHDSVNAVQKYVSSTTSSLFPKEFIDKYRSAYISVWFSIPLFLTFWVRPRLCLTECFNLSQISPMYCCVAYLSVPFSILRFLTLSSLSSRSLFSRTTSSSRPPVLTQNEICRCGNSSPGKHHLGGGGGTDLVKKMGEYMTVSTD
jgi:hypothetical protein